MNHAWPKTEFDVWASPSKYEPSTRPDYERSAHSSLYSPSATAMRKRRVEKMYRDGFSPSDIAYSWGVPVIMVWDDLLRCGVILREGKR